jgi:pimeloyl-ACP methyl ester carboxylesterase
MIPNLLGPSTHASRRHVAAELRQLIASQPAEGIADGLQAMMTRPDSAATLAAVRVPTLIMVGTEDTITPVSDAQSMHRAIPGSRLVTIHGVGHMSNMEAPGEFNAALTEFLQDL